MKTINFNRLVNVLLLIVMLYPPGLHAQHKYYTQLNVIFQTFITKDFQLLKPIVTSNKKLYRNGLAASNDPLFTQQICDVPSPESYRIVETETVGKNERITVEYQYVDGTKLHNFTFNPKGQLIGLKVAMESSTSL